MGRSRLVILILTITLKITYFEIKIYQNNLSALFCSNTFQLNTMNNIINTQQFTLIQSYLFKTEANDQIISINNNYQVNINYSACAISYNGIYKFMIKLSDTMTGIYLFNNNNTVNVLLFSQGQVYQKTITSNLINLNTDMNLDLLNINS